MAKILSSPLVLLIDFPILSVFSNTCFHSKTRCRKWHCKRHRPKLAQCASDMVLYEYLQDYQEWVKEFFRRKLPHLILYLHATKPTRTYEKPTHHDEIKIHRRRRRHPRKQNTNKEPTQTQSQPNSKSTQFRVSNGQIAKTPAKSPTPDTKSTSSSSTGSAPHTKTQNHENPTQPHHRNDASQSKTTSHNHTTPDYTSKDGTGHHTQQVNHEKSNEPTEEILTMQQASPQSSSPSSSETTSPESQHSAAYEETNNAQAPHDSEGKNTSTMEPALTTLFLSKVQEASDFIAITTRSTQDYTALYALHQQAKIGDAIVKYKPLPTAPPNHHYTYASWENLLGMEPIVAKSQFILEFERQRTWYSKKERESIENQPLVGDKRSQEEKTKTPLSLTTNRTQRIHPKQMNLQKKDLRLTTPLRVIFSIVSTPHRRNLLNFKPICTPIVPR